MVQLASVSAHEKEVFADPTQMGLLGLVVGCAALLSMAFGRRLSPAGLETAAVYCLLFGAGCQLLVAQGLVDLSGEDEARLSPAGIDRWESHLLG